VLSRYGYEGSKAMRLATLIFCALIAAFGVRPAEAQTLYTCGEGTVVGVQTIVEMVVGPPVVFTTDKWGEPQQLVELLPPAPHSAYVVTVQLFGVRYTAEAFTDTPENFDPTELNDDAISICVNRDRLILDRDNREHFRANIIRVFRVKFPMGTR